MPTKGIGLTKRALNESLTNNLASQLNLEEKLQTEAGETEDFEEGVNAFKEKGKLTLKENNMRTNKKTIAVIGAGTMGSGIAQVAAQNNHSVVLVDTNKKLLKTQRVNFKKF